MRRHRWSFAIALGLIVTVVPSVAPPVSAQGHPDRSIPGVGTVTWGPCTDETLVAFGAECGMLSVPLDYRRPKGEKIQIAVSRMQHTVPDEEYQGIMLVNPGGPGGSGLIYSVLRDLVPGGAGAAYDWIGFDPRGVGSSVPALSCDPDYMAGPRPRYEPTSPWIEGAWLWRSVGYARDCGQAGGRLLSHLKTTDNVADMDAIRQALGERQINFYGFSYGTYLGQVYATLHPERVRRMVLDANVDPRQVWYDANIDQDYAFEVVIQIFFDWVARHDDTYGLGGTADEVEAAYYAALEQLAASPQGALGASEWADAFLGAGYAQFLWPETADAFAAFVNGGDPGPATDLYLGQDTPGDDNGYAMYLATECTDAKWPRNWKTWHRDNTEVAEDAPFFTWGNAWFNAPCAFWPAKSGTPVNVKGRWAPPILLFSETLDAATPFEGSLEVRKRFPASALVATEGGTTHANTIFGGVQCADEALAAYLIDGTMPARQPGRVADVTCEAAPEPEPVTLTAATTARTAVTADLVRLLHPQTR
ncbi:MAG: alpha/beta hydrolase [Ilumatobacteraceae bacterium]